MAAGHAVGFVVAVHPVDVGVDDSDPAAGLPRAVSGTIITDRKPMSRRSFRWSASTAPPKNSNESSSPASDCRWLSFVPLPGVNPLILETLYDQTRGGILDRIKRLVARVRR